MSNVTRLPPHSKTVHVEADIPAAIKVIRALLGLQEIEKAINDHPTSGQAKPLVRFPVARRRFIMITIDRRGTP
ncbi:MAG: hypothetical protein ACLPV8_16845 [Steroidobacteraceae bacterium]